MSTFEITSELYAETDFNSIKTSDGSNNVISKFSFQFPLEDTHGNDKDGDLIVPRRRREVIEIEHRQFTVLKLVGLQIWRGAFLLADFIIANSKTEFNGKNILELGSGVGLTSIVAGFYSKSVVCTDLDFGGILELISSNFKRNSNLIKCKNMKVMELDFMAIKNWSSELNEIILKSDIIFAADVIYDDDLTDAFVSTIEQILSCPSENKKSIYIALEKRYVFTVADMDTCAPCYEYFLNKFQKLKNKFQNWKIQAIPLDFPQYFEYERTRALVLWKISN